MKEAKISQKSLGNFFFLISLGPTIRHATFSRLIEKPEDRQTETTKRERERERERIFTKKRKKKRKKKETSTSTRRPFCLPLWRSRIPNRGLAQIAVHGKLAKHHDRFSFPTSLSALSPADLLKEKTIVATSGSVIDCIEREYLKFQPRRL